MRAPVGEILEEAGIHRVARLPGDQLREPLLVLGLRLGTPLNLGAVGVEIFEVAQLNSSYLI